MMLFQFKMKDALNCMFIPAEVGKRRPVWYFMTDSEYCLDLGKVKLFEHSDTYLQKNLQEYPNHPKYFDYYYVRFLEDLFYELPKISCVMPDEIYAMHDEIKEWWFAGGEEEEWLTYELSDVIIQNLLWIGSIDTMTGGALQFLHRNDDIFVRYDFSEIDEDGMKTWTANSGEYRLSYEDFVAEIEDLLERFFARMDKQVQDVVANFTEKEVAEANIVAEHEERRTYFYGILDDVKQGKYENSVDWHQVREDLAYVVERIRR